MSTHSKQRAIIQHLRAKGIALRVKSKNAYGVPRMVYQESHLKDVTHV